MTPDAQPENSEQLRQRKDEYLLDEIERYRKRAEKAEQEVERLRSALLRMADWPDENMETARTLHYDFRGWARAALYAPPLTDGPIGDTGSTS